MQRQERFEKIKKFFTDLDATREKKELELTYETEKGIYGTSNIQDIYDWLESLELSDDTVFFDLGSGDGRVAITAALFCKAKGVEFDPELYKKSAAYAKELESNVELHQGDYTESDFSNVSILFCYADHDFSQALVDKLYKQFSGTLYVYQGTFFPEDATKGKTTWIGQTPLLTYTFGE